MRRSGMLIALAIAFVGWLFIPQGCFQCPFYNGTTLTRALIREAGKEKSSGEIDIEKFFGGEIYVLASFAADAWGQRLFPGQPAIYSEASTESDGIWYVLMSNQKDGIIYIGFWREVSAGIRSTTVRDAGTRRPHLMV